MKIDDILLEVKSKLYWGWDVWYDRTAKVYRAVRGDEEINQVNKLELEWVIGIFDDYKNGYEGYAPEISGWVQHMVPPLKTNIGA